MRGEELRTLKSSERWLKRLVDQLDLQEKKPSGADAGWSYRRDYVQRRTVVREPRRTVK